MAGIGFKLREIYAKESLSAYIKVYGYSALLSAGPWVSSILAILIIGFMKISTFDSISQIIEYQLLITYAYALASSLLFSGVIQLPFTRYIADRLYEKKPQMLTPAYFGAVIITLLVGIFIMLPVTLYVFDDQSTIFVILIVSMFVTMSLVWLTNILASSLKFYIQIVFAYIFSYSLIIFLSYFFGKNSISLIIIFLFGNLILLSILTTLILKSYPSDKLVDFAFFNPKKFYWRLALAGVFYNAGAWIDKVIFWYHPLTGEAIIGKMHGSIIYDVPIFLAYLTIIPSMAIFFFRLEAFFSQKYDLFFDAVKTTGTLSAIKRYKSQMSEVISEAIREILFIQALVVITLFVFAKNIFLLFNIPLLYLNLFYIDMIGAQLQLGFMSILALLYYLDKRLLAMWLSLLFFVLNGSLSYISIFLGPSFFGYGYAISLLISFALALFVIRKNMKDLEYETFLLR